MGKLVEELLKAFAESLGYGKTAVVPLFVFGLFSGWEKLINPATREKLRQFLLSAPENKGTLNTAAMTLTMFEGIFGKRYFSLRAIISSALSTLLCFSFVTIIMASEWFNAKDLHAAIIQDQPSLRAMCFLFFAAGIFPDFISLLKGRFFLIRYSKYHSVMMSFALVIFDLILSAAIATSAFVVVDALTLMLEGFHISWYFLLQSYFTGIYMCISRPNFAGEYNSFYSFIFFCSTMTTSVWMVFVGTSLFITRAFSIPMKSAVQATRFLFDVEKKPVQSLGVTLAFLCWIVAIAWSEFHS